MLKTLIVQVEQYQHYHYVAGCKWYTPTAWNAALAAVNAESPPSYYNQWLWQLKERYHECKSDWRLWKQMKKLPGFAVNAAGVMVGQSDAITQFLERHPDARKYRRKPFLYEQLQDVLFDEVVASSDIGHQIRRKLAKSIADHSSSESEYTESDIYEGIESNSCGNMESEVYETDWDESQAAMEDFREFYWLLPPKLNDKMMGVFDDYVMAQQYLVGDRSSQKEWVKWTLDNVILVELQDEELKRAVEEFEWTGEDKLRKLPKRMKDFKSRATEHFLNHYSVLDLSLRAKVLEEFESEDVAKLYLHMHRDQQHRFVKRRVDNYLEEIQDERMKLYVEQLDWKPLWGALQLKDTPRPECEYPVIYANEVIAIYSRCVVSIYDPHIDCCCP